jgi:alpha-galactosidase
MILASAVVVVCSGSAMAAGKPLKVYVLAGRSNVQGHARAETFGYIGDDPATVPMLKEMRGPDCKTRACENIWITISRSGKVLDRPRVATTRG